MGIRREALFQAVQEHMGTHLLGNEHMGTHLLGNEHMGTHLLGNLVVGDRVFAKSADNAFYVATVQKVEQNLITVQFVNGSSHVLPLTDLRPFGLLPGQKVVANWSGRSWGGGTVEQYNVKTGKVRVSDGMRSKNFSLNDIRLPREKTRREIAVRTLLWRVGAFTAIAGGAIGALLMRWLGG
jgi:hypothetical protein